MNVFTLRFGQCVAALTKAQTSWGIAPTLGEFSTQKVPPPSPCTSVTATLTATYKEGDSKQTLLLATETDDGSDWSEEDNPFPGQVGDWTLPGSVFVDEEMAPKLAHPEP